MEKTRRVYRPESNVWKWIKNVEVKEELNL